MAAILPPEAGAPLDRKIARLVDGPRIEGEVAPYSSDETAAQRLATRLETLGITSTFEEDAGCWYCVFWAPRPGDGTQERVASGGGSTRALAVCRAVMNLPLAGTGKRLRLQRSTRGWIDDEAPGPHAASPAVGPRPRSGEEESLEPPRAARGS